VLSEHSFLVIIVIITITGPSVLDVINTLLRHLHTSVNSQCLALQKSTTKSAVRDQSDLLPHADVNLDQHAADLISVEQRFQNAIVDAIGMTFQHT